MMKFRKYMLIVLIPLILFGCIQNVVQKVLISESEVNLSIYIKQINDIANSYNLIMIEEIDPNIDNDISILRVVRITLSEQQYVVIRLGNSGGRESFGVYYYNSLENNENDINRINIDLFIEFINEISGKKVTKDFIVDFLTSPEEKYKSDKTGRSKMDDELISKAYDFNFTSDWSVIYTLYKNQDEILCFVGLTKKGTVKQ